MQEAPQGKTGLPDGTARDTAKTRVIEYGREQEAVQRKECEVCVVCGGFTREVECIGLKDAYNLDRQTGANRIRCFRGGVVWEYKLNFRVRPGSKS